MSIAGDAAVTRDSGATLMETLVVVALTAMAATILFPRVERGYAAVSLHEGTAVLMADLRTAHATAIRTAARVTFSVGDDGRTYAWTPGFAKVTPSGVNITPAGAAIAFFPDGSTTGGALMLSSGASRVVVAVDPSTAAVSAGSP